MLDNQAVLACIRARDNPYSVQQGCLTPRNWHQRCPTANGTQNLPKDDQFPTSIAIVTINHTHSRTVEIVLSARPQKHTSVRTAFFQLKAELLVCLHPLNDSIQNACKHYIENEWLKQINNQRCDKKSTQMLRRKNGTNQNFIARPGNVQVYSSGRQGKSLPQTFNQFIAPTQLEHIDEGRYFGEHRKLRVSVSGSTRN